MVCRVKTILGLGLVLVAGPLRADLLSVPVEIDLAAGVAAPEPLAAMLVAKPIKVSAGAEVHSAFEVPVELPGTAMIQLPRESTWRLGLRVEGYWTDRVLLETGAVAKPVQLTAFPAGWIEGQVTVPPKEESPSRIGLRFTAAPGSGGELPSAEQECPVDGGRFRCLLPAGKLDLRLHAEGFVAHYRWAAEVPAHKRLRLGTLELRPGASVVGWIEAVDRAASLEKARVALLPQVAGFAERDIERPRHGSLELRGKVSERGFFQIVDAPPGNYALTVDHPGYAPARVAPVRVEGRAETEVAPVLLELPVTLRVEVFPPTDPSHKRWGLRLFQQEAEPGHLEMVEEGVSTEDGIWEIEGLAPGSYRLRLLDSWEAPWAWESVELTPQMAPVRIEVPAIRLEGRVRLGDEPLPSFEAMLREHPWGGAQVVKQGTPEGSFYAFLPRGKVWDVRIRHEDLHVVAKFSEIEVPPKRDGEPWPVYDFEIPDTRLEGIVVTPEDEPQPGISIDVQAGNTPRERITTDAEGRFELRGLNPGPVRVQASAESLGMRSDLQRVEVEDGETTGPVRLVLQEDLRISGLVMSPDGHGIPGTRVAAILEQEPGQQLSFSFPETHSDLDGVFELELPAGARAVLLTFFPPGFAVTQTRVSLPPTEPLLVTAEPAGGTLVVAYEEPPEHLDEVVRLKLNTILFHDFVVGGSYHLTAWAQLHGIPGSPGSLVVPMLEPGSYRVCVDREARVSGFAGAPLSTAAKNRCEEGYLAPGGKLTLTIPAEVWQADLAESIKLLAQGR